MDVHVGILFSVKLIPTKLSLNLMAVSFFLVKLKVTFIQCGNWSTTQFFFFLLFFSFFLFFFNVSIWRFVPCWYCCQPAQQPGSSAGKIFLGMQNYYQRFATDHVTLYAAYPAKTFICQNSCELTGC